MKEAAEAGLPWCCYVQIDSLAAAAYVLHAAAAETAAHLLKILVQLRLASSRCCYLAAAVVAAAVGSCWHQLAAGSRKAPHMLLAAGAHLAELLSGCAVLALAADLAWYHMSAMTLSLLRLVQAAAAAS